VLLLREQTDILLKISRHFATRRLITAFRAWAFFARRGTAIALMAQARARRLLAWAFAAIYEVAHFGLRPTRNEVMVRMAAHQALRLLRDAFLHWLWLITQLRTATAVRAEEKAAAQAAALARCSRHSLRRSVAVLQTQTLQGWAAVAAESRRRRLAAERADGMRRRMDARVLAASLATWSASVAEAEEEVSRALRIAARMKRLRAGQAVAAWRHKTQLAAFRRERLR